MSQEDVVVCGIKYSCHAHAPMFSVGSHDVRVLHRLTPYRGKATSSMAPPAAWVRKLFSRRQQPFRSAHETVSVVSTRDSMAFSVRIDTTRLADDREHNDVKTAIARALAPLARVHNEFDEKDELKFVRNDGITLADVQAALSGFRVELTSPNVRRGR